MVFVMQYGVFVCVYWERLLYMRYTNEMLITRFVQEKNIHRAFVAMLFLKGCHAVVEILGGMFFLDTHLFGAFGASYLLSHGIVKVILVVSILRGKWWAYPATLFFLVLLIVYQLYQLEHTYTLFLLLLTLFDMVLMFLTWHEYRFIKKHPLGTRYL